MQCSELITKIDDWSDCTLSEAEQQAFAAHLESCSACHRRVLAEQRLSLAMAALSTPEPDDGFEQRMLQAAHGKTTERRWTTPALGGAMAACLVAGLFLGQFMPDGRDNGQSAPPVAVGPVVSDEIQTVGLAFSSGEALENVTLTLELPAHIELASFPGERSISWEVDLDQGPNLLSLPVRMLFPGEGELIAHLDDGNRRKTFRTPVGAIGQQYGRES